VYLLASFEQTIEIDSIFNADRDQKLIAGMPWEDGGPFSCPGAPAMPVDARET
jgi:hypothetical protein